MLLCFVVSSRGLTNDRLDQLVASLSAQTSRRFVVGVCDQSREGSVTEELARRWSGTLRLYVCRSGPGLSAGRNAVVARAPSDVTHFAFPNDTTVLPADFVENIERHRRDEDVLEVSYLEAGRAGSDSGKVSSHLPDRTSGMC